MKAWHATQTVEVVLARRGGGPAAQAVALLPEPYRQVLVLADAGRLSLRTVAGLLDLSAGAVRQRLQRARLLVYDAEVFRRGGLPDSPPPA
jgi:DNA-directed RNA polymerase specialized sigma24 family protein